jgi:hypothetical protein
VRAEVPALTPAAERKFPRVLLTQRGWSEARWIAIALQVFDLRTVGPRAGRLRSIAFPVAVMMVMVVMMMMVVIVAPRRDHDHARAVIAVVMVMMIVPVMVMMVVMVVLRQLDVGVR